MWYIVLRFQLSCFRPSGTLEDLFPARKSICVVALAGLTWACTAPGTLVRSNKSPRSDARLDLQRPPALCEQECVVILHAGVAWLADRYRVSRSTVIVDTVRTRFQVEKPTPGAARVLTGALVGNALSGRSRGWQWVVPQEADYRRHHSVGWPCPTVLPVLERTRMHADLAGRLLLLQPEIQAPP